MAVGLLTGPEITVVSLLAGLDLDRVATSSRIAADPDRRARLGQFLTPADVARFMADMLQIPEPPGELRLFDGERFLGPYEEPTRHVRTGKSN